MAKDRHSGAAAMLLGWLIPRSITSILAYGSSLVALLAQIQFSNTITVGSIIVAALVVIASGLFTLRNNMRSFWRNLAEERGEEIKVLEKHLREREDARAQDAEEQRAIRHELKNQIAELNANLRVEQTKTDLSALIELLAKQHTEAMTQFSTIIGLLATANGESGGAGTERTS